MGLKRALGIPIAIWFNLPISPVPKDEVLLSLWSFF